MTTPFASADLWRHKARALLLPTPLALVDPTGEPARVAEVLRWLELQQSDRTKLHEECRETALGAHVPGAVAPPAGAAKPTENGVVDVPPLLHPLGGQVCDGSTHKLADLCAAWRTDWRALKPPTDSATYRALWYHIQHAERGKAPWHAGIPGHDQLRDHPWFSQRNMAAALVGARFDGGSACLLFVHCGPVQSFIAAARRTSDLWLGSYLVSLLSYQATRAIAEYCGPDAIIYPHLASAPLALRQQFTNRKFDVRRCLQASQPNRFVALVSDVHVQRIAESAGQAVLTRWQAMAGRVKENLASLSDLNDGFEGFEQQISAHPEIDIIAQPWPTDPAQLGKVLSAAGDSTRPAVAGADGHAAPRYGEVFSLGRTTLGGLRRVQRAAPPDGDPRSKCTQCGRREAMGPWGGGRNHREWWEKFRANLQSAKAEHGERDTESKDAATETIDFRKGEALCAVCLTKRFAHRFDLAADNPDVDLKLRWDTKDDRLYLRFPSVASIAAAPARRYVLEHASHEATQAWAAAVASAHDVLGFTPPGNLLRGIGELGRGCPFLNPDGTWMYDRSYQLDTLLRDHDDPQIAGKAEALGKHVACAKKLLRQLLRAAPQDPSSDSVRPTPYYAVVVLDVDNMGSWLDGTHRSFPTLRSVQSASGVPPDKQVDTDNKRPISPSAHSEISRRQSVLATRTLHEIVERNLGRLVYSGGDDVLAFLPLHTVWVCLAEITAAFQHRDALGSKVNVSAGVAISDWRSPLSLALRRAREAENRAKAPRNRIAVHLAIRSGAPVDLLLRWNDLTELVQTVNRLASPGTDQTDEVANSSAAELLMRPSAIDSLRRELHTLRAQGLEGPFKQRVRVLLRGVPAFVERLVDERHGGEIGGVLDALLLLRFLAREQGGIPYATPPRRETKS